MCETYVTLFPRYTHFRYLHHLLRNETKSASLCFQNRLLRQNSAPTSHCRHPMSQHASNVIDEGHNVTMSTTENNYAIADNMSDEAQWIEYESPMSRIMEIYVTLPLFFLSLIGNSLIFIVFSRKHYIGNLTAMLYQILAAADGLVVLIHDGLHTLPVVMLGKSVITHNLATCKLAIFISKWSRTFSIWIIVVLTTERLICAYWPYQAKKVNTKRNYGCLLFSLLLLCCIIYVPLLKTVGHEDSVFNGQDIGICRISGEGGVQWYTTIFYWMNVLMCSFIPFLFVCVSNIVIIYDLRKSSSATNTRGPSKRRSDRVKNNITILLLISTTSVVFTIPYPLYTLLCSYVTDTTSDAFHKWITFSYIVPIFDSLNRSINIILFCVFGRNFRQHLKNFLLCYRKRTMEVLPMKWGGNERGNTFEIFMQRFKCQPWSVLKWYLHIWFLYLFGLQYSVKLLSNPADFGGIR